MTWHGQIDATDIQVDVNDGIVTLTGTVDSRREKRMAEDVAESVSGVWDVNNHLSLQQISWTRGEIGDQIREGMEVIGRDGDRIGQVKEVRANDFLVDRPLARDVYIPISACRSTNGRIRLNVRADEVDNQGWPNPELMDTS